MIQALAKERQIIVATQSPLLVDSFGLDEIIVLDLQDGETHFRRLDPDARISSGLTTASRPGSCGR